MRLKLMKSRFPFVVALATVALFSNSAKADIRNEKFRRSVFSGTMNSNLPTIETQNATPTVYFSSPNKLSFSTTLFCGDGDVALFQQHNPQMSFYTQEATKKGKLVVGYWVTPGTKSDVKDVDIPTNATWYSIGSLDLANDGTATRTLLQSNANASAEADAFQLLTNALGNLQMIANDAKWLQGKSSYSVYAATMICPDFQVTDGAKGGNGESNGALSEVITRQFSEGVMAGGGTRLDLFVSNLTITFSNMGNVFSTKLNSVGVSPVSTGQTGINISLGAAPDGTKDYPTGSTMSSLQSLAQNLQSYLTGQGQDGKISSAITALDNLSKYKTCTLTSPGNYDFTTPQFAWEPMVVKAACGYAATNALNYLSTVKSAYNYMKSVCVPPPPGQPLNPACDPARIQMAKILIITIAPPVLMATAAYSLKNKVDSKKIALNKTSCLPTSNLGNLNYISKIAGSLHIPMIKTGNNIEIQDPGKMAHPEPNFAIGEYVGYQGSKGDNRAVFNSAYATTADPLASKPSGLVLSMGGTQNYTFSTPGVNFQLNARAIGCPGPAFCMAQPLNH